jgi:hypothetical protein
MRALEINEDKQAVKFWTSQFSLPCDPSFSKFRTRLKISALFEQFLQPWKRELHPKLDQGN